MLEKDLQNRILQYLQSIGCYVRKVSLANRNGTPDLIGCFRGQFFAIEVKTIRRALTDLQRWNLEQIRKAGGQVIVASSLEDVKMFIQKKWG